MPDATITLTSADTGLPVDIVPENVTNFAVVPSYKTPKKTWKRVTAICVTGSHDHIHVTEDVSVLRSALEAYRTAKHSELAVLIGAEISITVNTGV